MHNQRIFNALFRHVSAVDIKAGNRPERWELPEQSYLVMLCCCYDGSGFVRTMDKPPALWGWTQTDFLHPDGAASSVVSLIFKGHMRYVDESWCIVAGSAKRRLTVPLPENADLGLIHASVPSDAVVMNVANYVRTHRHSRITWPTFFAGQRTSDSVR